MTYLEQVAARTVSEPRSTFRVGDQIRVNYRIVEGDKKRIQPFEGVVIMSKKGKANASFTVRKMSEGIGVERCFPLHSPLIESIDVLNRGRVRRSRLFYLRELQGKKARIQSLAGSAQGAAETPSANSTPAS